MKKIDLEIIKNIKTIGVEMIDEAASGHPGIVLGSASLLYVLFKNHLNFDVKNPKWINRDRFVLSAGHGSALLYSLMFFANYDITIDDIKKFRQFKSKTSGHPEYWEVPGIEATTGPLGQGISMSVGMALAQKWLSNNYYNNAKNDLFDHYIYCLCGDGDLQEGISYESMSFAGKQNLSNLIIFYASNDIQLDGKTSETTCENIKQRVESQNFNYLRVDNPNDLELIDKTISNAKNINNNKPTFIEVKTIIGQDTNVANSCAAHGAALTPDNLKDFYKRLNWDHPKFYYDLEYKNYLSDHLYKRSSLNFSKWNEKFKTYKQENPSIASIMEKPELDIDIDKALSGITLEPAATRDSCGKIFTNIFNQYIGFIGGSADLSGSTRITGKNGVFSDQNLVGQEIKFGVREFGMAGIVNGINLHSFFHGYGSTFLVFADYPKAAIRLAALMKLHSLFIFSHDSVFVGEDGPTHQPIEQVANLRNVMNLNLWRPANTLETAYALKNACEVKTNPNVIVTTRQIIDVPNNTIHYDDFKKGAYIFYETNSDFNFIILTSGSELENAYKVAKKFEQDDNKSVRIISVPCLDLFMQNCDYVKSLMGIRKVPKIVIEATNSVHWRKIIGCCGQFIGIEKYGYSAKMNDLVDYYQFDIDSIYHKITKFLESKHK